MADEKTTPTKAAAPSKASLGMQLADRIRESSNVLVALSKDPSVDELSAALGLTFILDKIGKHPTAIFSGAVPNAIEFLEPEKTFETNTNSLQDFIIALNKEKADHLRYKIDGDFVKVFITPYKTTISEQDLEFTHGDYNVDLVIALNVPSAADLDGALSEYGRIMHDATSANITAGEPGKFCDLEWGDKNASSVSEMVAKLAEMLKDPKEEIFDKSIATALLAGIVSATNRFSNEHTTPDTMNLASKLMSAGADQQLISSSISSDMLKHTPVDTEDLSNLKEEEPKKDSPVSQSATNDATVLSVSHADAATSTPTTASIDASSSSRTLEQDALDASSLPQTPEQDATLASSSSRTLEQDALDASSVSVATSKADLETGTPAPQSSTGDMGNNADMSSQDAAHPTAPVLPEIEVPAQSPQTSPDFSHPAADATTEHLDIKTAPILDMPAQTPMSATELAATDALEQMIAAPSSQAPSAFDELRQDDSVAAAHNLVLTPPTSDPDSTQDFVSAEPASAPAPALSGAQDFAPTNPASALSGAQDFAPTNPASALSGAQSATTTAEPILPAVLSENLSDTAQDNSLDGQAIMSSADEMVAPPPADATVFDSPEETSNPLVDFVAQENSALPLPDSEPILPPPPIPFDPATGLAAPMPAIPGPSTFAQTNPDSTFAQDSAVAGAGMQSAPMADPTQNPLVAEPAPVAMPQADPGSFQLPTLSQ